MVDERLERVARALFLKGLDWPQGVEEEEYTFYKDQWLKMAAAVIAELAGELEDNARMDWVEAQTNGDRWIARQSRYGRGFRLHNEKGTFRTAREAIDEARG